MKRECWERERVRETRGRGREKNSGYLLLPCFYFCDFYLFESSFRVSDIFFICWSIRPNFNFLNLQKQNKKNEHHEKKKDGFSNLFSFLVKTVLVLRGKIVRRRVFDLEAKVGDGHCNEWDNILTKLRFPKFMGKHLFRKWIGCILGLS